MKSVISKFLFLFVLSGSWLSVAHAADQYTFDPGHTYVLWHINHFGFSNPSGKWMAEGTLTWDEAKPENDKVNIVIHTANITTGIPKLDEHLQSADFFDVAKFPTATFVSDKVDMTGKDKAKVSGTLTVHGVAKPVTLDVKLNKSGVSPITQKQTLGFSGSTTVKRSDFGIDKYLPGLGDDVKIEIEAEASKVG
ncbi:MAG TPA: YceI family protein [Gammaproteobacteria bacterium]|nr:YceI family protein [Gammaproteobacteria bacterium]